MGYIFRETVGLRASAGERGEVGGGGGRDIIIWFYRMIW